ncbi:tail tape measure protein [Winogradskyella phage Peternella_1]|uniref:Tail tape measure protein n=1 Tax=Winogradskyella phage Peternella_1 TaxID=2745699 RepID=A0A8E5EA61_9CAUD|nr:tail tape measure protein [Winogradskyella phage Peternella_1]QQV91583.1 tail tape measure protein [Winogradskyella phage Peternella_1]
MATNTKTSWILELIDKVTAPMKSVDKNAKSFDATIKTVTSSLDGMDDTAKAAANQAIKSFNDLGSEIAQEQKKVDGLKKHLDSLGDSIDPLLKAQIDFDIKQAETKVRRYKEQLVEVQHELEEIETGPEPAKLKANWGAAVVIANQTVELVNKAISGLAFTTTIEDLRTNVQRMSGESGDALDDLTARAYKLGAVFKEAPDEIAKAANAMTKQIGGSYAENFALIEAGFEKGANINGDFIDQLKEYPTFINQLGLSQSQAIALMAKAGSDGIFSDKAIDSIKEADLSLREIGQPQIDALKGIGLAAEDLAGKTSFEAVQMISKSMEGATTQAKQLVLADIFKGAGEDAGLAWIEGLGSIDLDINNIPSIEQANAGIKGWLADLQTSFSNTFGSIASSVVELSPVVTGIASVIPIVSQLTKVTWLQTAATKVSTAAQWLWNAALTANPIGLVIVGVAALVGAIVWLTTSVEGWGEAWTHTWNGAKLLFEAWVTGVKASFNLMINGLMMGINKIKLGWYEFKQSMGIGDSAENQKMIDGINADTEARKQSIIDGYKKAADLALEATSEFVRAPAYLKLKEDEETDTQKIEGNTTPGLIAPTLDGNINNGGGSSKTGGLQGSAKGMVKSVNMTLNITNNFSIADAAANKIDKIADMVTGKINDRLRDAMLSV